MQDTNFKAKAFLFDLNGTMINDMKFHADAWFNIITKKLGKDISYADVNKEMYGKNEELLVRVFGENYFTKEQIEEISIEKEKSYQSAFLPELKLIDGLGEFLSKAEANEIKMAIGSAAIPFNIDFVLDGLDIRSYFHAIVSAQDVKTSKPDPETFLNAALALRVEAKDCLVFEDVPKGVESAKRAGMKCIVITTTHIKEEFEHFDNVLYFVENYHDPILSHLF
ncbi:MAG: HAD family phosphatase [Pedobacter sp.]|nr:MAG: HAD family phosphatase [Pedobacter sp.]